MSYVSDQHHLTWLAQQVILRPSDFSRHRLGSTAASTFRAEPVAGDFLGGAYKISAKMLAGYVTGEHRCFEVEVPASWWQHARFSVPPWWRGLPLVKRYRRKHPVRMTTSSVSIDFSRYLAYPMADIILPPSDFGYGVVTDMFSQEILSPAGWLARCEATETRYASRYQVANAMERAAGDVIREQGPDGSLAAAGRLSARDYLDALARLGVNPDQLISEAMLDRRLLCRVSR